MSYQFKVSNIFACAFYVNRMHFLLITVAVIICCYLYYVKKKRQNVNDFPEPPKHIIFGHIYEFTSTTKLLQTCTKFITKHGSIVKLRAGPITGLLTTDYKFIEFLLTNNKNLIKSENYEYLRPWLGSGLIISEGSEWKRNRKIITPTFHFEMIKKFVGVFESAGSVFIEKLEKFNGSASIDLCPLLTLCTLDVICETAMGTKIDSQNGRNSSYVNSVNRMTHIFINRSLSPLKLFNSTFVLTKDYYVQKKLLKILHEFTSNVIRTRKQEIKKTENVRKKMALLDLLLHEQNLNDEQIRNQVDTFMFAGHDTTATGIGFTLYCLAHHHDIQEKVLREQKELFGNEKDPPITYQGLQNMKYLEHVIKESLRLYPPVPVIGKKTTNDIEFDSHIIGKHTNIILFVYGIHRNPQFFPEPEKFDPDRFNTLDGSLPYAYIPFSAGERNCIGQKFALLEMKSIIAKVIRHFELIPATPKHQLVLAAEIVLKSTSGIKVGIRKRT